MSVIGHHVLDLFKLFPANVALVGVANQRPPLLTGLAPSPATRLSLLIMYRMLGSAVRIRARVCWVGQHGVDGGVPRSSPLHLVARSRNGNLKSLFQKPQQRLPCGADFEKFAEHQPNAFLHAAVRILFQTVLALDIPA